VRAGVRSTFRRMRKASAGFDSAKVDALDFGPFVDDEGNFKGDPVLRGEVLPGPLWEDDVRPLMKRCFLSGYGCTRSRNLTSLPTAILRALQYMWISAYALA